MIEITPSSAFLIYLLLSLGTLMAIWLYSHYLDKKKQHVALDSRLTTCEYCHTTYVTPSDQSISNCPQCNSFNKIYK